MLGFIQFSSAQEGYSSAALSMGKMSSNQGSIPLPEHVVVEEYFNYHKHDLPLPKNGEPIAIDIASRIVLDDNYVLQIGLTTTTNTSLDKIPPVNVCLVIDKSGSMEGDRIEKAKEAAVEFVDRLREKDILSVVLFDDAIDVLIPSQHVTNKTKLIETIKGVQIGGSTDLYGGIIKGYDEVFKNYSDKQNNKIIVLTDAITNTGVVDPTAIVSGSGNYKQEHEIDITMVGVGVDFNNSLSRKISESNSSSIFFINDAEDIKKIFIDEIESLLSPIARDAKLTIELSPELEIEKCFGYTPLISNNTISFDLENMNSGLTQVFLFKLKNDHSRTIKSNMVSVKLDFYDIEKQEKSTLNYSTKISENKNDNLLDVQKNYVIARMAQCIKDVSVLCEKEDFSEAKHRMKYILTTTLSLYPKMLDEDIKRVYTILDKYNSSLIEQTPTEISEMSFPY